MSKFQRSERTRNWACIVYPDSAPENWLDIVKALHVDCLISPLHGLDFNANGEPKKPHFHVIFIFSSVKSRDQASEIFSSFGGVGCEYVQSIRAYARYLCHLDNPEKAQYKIDDVQCFGVIDYRDIISSCSDRVSTLRDILLFIKENDCLYYCDLVDYAMRYQPEWFYVLVNSSTLFISSYLKSIEYKQTKKTEKE